MKRPDVLLPRTVDPVDRWRGVIARECRAVRSVFRLRLLFWSALARLVPDAILAPLRALFYRWGGCGIGRHVSMLGRLTLIGAGDIASRLHIGDGTLIAPHVVLGLDGNITIGCNVSIGPYVKLYTATHSMGFGSRRMRSAVMSKPIVVEDGVWVGMECLILPGVTLGRGSVISAGSVVSEDVPPNTLVGGNPAVARAELPFGNR